MTSFVGLDVGEGEVTPPTAIQFAPISTPKEVPEVFSHMALNCIGSNDIIPVLREENVCLERYFRFCLFVA